MKTATKTLTVRAAWEKHYDKSELGPQSHNPFLSAFHLWEECTEDPDVRDITNAVVDQFRTKALETGLQPTTINGYWRAIRRVLRRIGPADSHNPWGLGLIPFVAGMKPVKEPYKRPKRIPMEELAKVYQMARYMRKPVTASPQQGLFWQCALVFAYFTALRISDIIKAEWKDFHEAEGTLFVRCQKTKVEMDMPLHPAVIEHLNRLHRNHERIFGGITKRWFHEVWQELKELAGVDWGWHDIRRTAGSEINAVFPGMGKVLLMRKSGDLDEKFYLNHTPELREAIERMACPLPFKHGIKMTDRAVRKVRQEILKAEEFVPPMRPPREAFTFTPHGFAFLGRHYPLTGNSLAILRTLVESDCVCTQRQLWEATDNRAWPKTASARTRLYLRVSDARIALRTLLGISTTFNPIASVRTFRTGDTGRYELCLPAEILKERKGGAA